MKLSCVSITGADDAVNIADLNDLAASFPFVEFAVLLMPEQMGKSRFPSLSWIKDFKQKYKGGQSAMHLCGSAFLGFSKGNKDILDLMKSFKRIQLNLKFGDVSGKYEPEALIKQVKSYPEFEFIFQCRGDNEDLLAGLKSIANHTLLFDESAGRGLHPGYWPAPLSGHRCGYAGGITPENLQETLQAIENATGDYRTWIDMESGIRTDDRFDIEKVRQVLRVASPYIV